MSRLVSPNGLSLFEYPNLFLIKIAFYLPLSFNSLNISLLILVFSFLSPLLLLLLLPLEYDEECDSDSDCDSDDDELVFDYDWLLSMINYNYLIKLTKNIRNLEPKYKQQNIKQYNTILYYYYYYDYIM